MAAATMELEHDLRLLVVSPEALIANSGSLGVGESHRRIHVRWAPDLDGARDRLAEDNLDAVLMDARLAESERSGLQQMDLMAPLLVLPAEEIRELVATVAQNNGPIRVHPSMERLHILAHLIHTASHRRRARQAEEQLADVRERHSAAEATASRFRMLADTSAEFFATLDYTQTLSSLAHHLAGRLADWVVIYVMDESGAVGRLEVAHKDPEKERILRTLREETIPADAEHPVLEVIRTREPVIALEVDQGDLASVELEGRLLDIVREMGVASAMILPLVARGRALGAITLVCTDKHFDEDSVSLANETAFRAALALDNARLYLDARRANEEKTQLLAVISHDLRTPLTSIIGYADLFTMGIPEPLSDRSLQQVGRIRMAAKHLLYLIEELLSFSRADRDGDLQLRDLLVKEVVYEVTSVMHPMATEQGLEFSVTLPEERVVMRTDPGKLRQILLNLAGNAVKFTEDGTVHLDVERDDGYVVFRITDTGIGIDPENMERIFKPFWQVHGTRSQGVGTGLGLSVVRRLVTALQGEISVQSELGEGSVFTVVLPRRLVGPGEAEEAPESQTSAPPPGEENSTQPQSPAQPQTPSPEPPSD